MIQQPLQVSTPSMYETPDHSNNSNTASGQSTPRAGASGNSTPKLGVSPSVSTIFWYKVPLLILRIAASNSLDHVIGNTLLDKLSDLQLC